MQCANASWVSTVHPPLIRKPNSNSQSKLSFSQTTTQIVRNPHRNYDDGDGESDVVTLPLPSHVKSITSPSNPFVKHCVKLRNSSSYRHSHGSALVVGTTPIRETYRFHEAMQERSTRIECLLLLDEAEVPEDLDDASIHIVRVSSMVMKKVSGLQSNESIEAIALMRIPTSFHNVDDDEGQDEPDCENWFPSSHRILVLEGIQDPGNLGTLLRSAMAFRWGGAFLLPGCCDPFNEKALRASRGASFQLPIVSGRWNQLEVLRKKYRMKILAGHPESGNDQESNPVSRLSQKFANSLADTPLCLVLGSEGTGLSEKSKQVCELVCIPMAGKFESLNVAVAGTVCKYFVAASTPKRLIITSHIGQSGSTSRETSLKLPIGGKGRVVSSSWPCSLCSSTCKNRTVPAGCPYSHRWSR